MKCPLIRKVRHHKNYVEFIKDTKYLEGDYAYVKSIPIFNIFILILDFFAYTFVFPIGYYFDYHWERTGKCQFLKRSKP